jgi:hypothetical protein
MLEDFFKLRIAVSRLADAGGARRERLPLRAPRVSSPFKPVYKNETCVV